MGCFQSDSLSPISAHMPKLEIKVKNIWFKKLQLILNELLISDDSSTIFPKSFWSSFLSPFMTLSMNKSQILELTDNLQNLIDFNFKGSFQIGNQNLTIKNFGEKFHQIENQLFFKGERLKRYLEFVQNASERQWQKKSKECFFCYSSFAFSDAQILKIAAKVRYFCQEDMKAFAFLSLYLQKSAVQMLCNQYKNYRAVESLYIMALKLLEQKFPANTSKQPPKQIQQKNSSKAAFIPKIGQFVFETIKFSGKEDAYAKLEKIIIEKSKEAKSKKDQFDNLVKDLCYKKGYGFKSGVKIKSENNKDSIFRTIEKLVHKHITKIELAANQKSMFYSRQELKKLLAKQKLQVVKQIKSFLQESGCIVFEAKDLLRGKSTFQKIQDIIEASESIIKRIEENPQKYQLIEIKNKLYKHTKDLVLIIGLGTVVAELQLVLKLDSVSNEFNHKIYELKRSQVYSPLTNLFIHNRKWSVEFFGDFMDSINTITETTLKYNFLNLNAMEDFVAEKDLVDFLTILQYEASVQIKSLEEQAKDQEQVTNRINSLIKLVKSISQGQKNIKQKNSQLISEVQYYVANKNFKKAQKLVDYLNETNQQQLPIVLNLKALIAYGLEKNNQALEYYQKVLSMKQQKKQENTIEYTLLLNKIGMILMNKGNYQQALQNYTKSLQIQTQISGVDSNETADTIVNIGLIFVLRGNYVKALQNYNKALEIQTKKYGTQSMEIAEIMIKLGVLYLEKGDHKKSLQCYNKALQIKSYVKGTDSEEVANILQLIGNVFSNQGYYKKSLENFSKCFEVFLKTRGQDSVQIADIYTSIGQILNKQGNFDQAQEHYDKAYKIYLQKKGYESIQISRVLKKISQNLTSQKNYEQAIRKINQAQIITIKIQGKESNNAAFIKRVIGNIYLNKNDIDKALFYYKQSLQLKQKITGPESYDAAELMNNIGLALTTKRQFTSAFQYYKKSLQIKTKILGEHSLDVAWTQNNIGILFQQKGDYEKALEYYEESLKTKKQVVGQISHEVAMTLKNIGNLYSIQQHYRKGLEYYNRSLEIYGKIQGISEDIVKQVKDLIKQMKTKLF